MDVMGTHRTYEGSGSGCADVMQRTNPGNAYRAYSFRYCMFLSLERVYYSSDEGRPHHTQNFTVYQTQCLREGEDDEKGRK